MLTEALQANPAVERADVVRRAELAVLAEDVGAALSLLATGTRRPRGPLETEPESGGAWLDLLTYCARVLAEEAGLLPDVLAAARRLHTSPGVAWMVALAALPPATWIRPRLPRSPPVRV